MPYKPNVLDQHCAARQALDLISDKWSVMLIYALVDGAKRYNQLRRMIGGVTPKMLTQTLRRMETSGIIHRTVYPVSPPKVEYSLTPLGETLIVPLTALCQWAEEHAREVETLRQNLFITERLKAEL